VEGKINLLGRLAGCFQDRRMPLLVKHQLPEMLAQHIWSRARRVVAKAEYLEKGENPRFVVISLSAEEWPARSIQPEALFGFQPIQSSSQDHVASSVRSRGGEGGVALEKFTGLPR
jgi:hypothetical protein